MQLTHHRNTLAYQANLGKRQGSTTLHTARKASNAHSLKVPAHYGPQRVQQTKSAGRQSWVTAKKGECRVVP